LAVIFYFVDKSKINIVGVCLPQHPYSSCKRTKCCRALHVQDLLLHDRVFYHSRDRIKQFFPNGRITHSKRNLCNISNYAGDDGLLKFDTDHSWFICVMFKFSKYYDTFMKSSQDKKNRLALFQEIQQFFKDYKPKPSTEYNYQWNSDNDDMFGSNSSSTEDSDDELFKQVNFFIDEVQDNPSMVDDDCYVNNNNNNNASIESKYAPFYREAVEKLKFFTDVQYESGQTELFHGTEWVVQRMCARDGVLNSIVEKGLQIWYSYCFDYCFPLEIDFRRMLNRYDPKELSKVIKPILLKESSSSGLSKSEVEWIKNNFIKKHPKLPLPSRVYKVPWIHALSLVSKRSVILKAGQAYFTYADAVEWLMCRWENSVNKWKKWDLENIFQPLMNKFIKKRRGDWTRVAKYLNKQEMQIWRNSFWKDYRKPHLLAELFFNIDNISEKTDGRFEDSEDATLEIFQTTVNNWWKRRKDIVGNINQRRFAIKSKSFVDIQHIVTKKTRKFKEDWLPLLPPCISESIKKCFETKTHLIDKQRLFVFKFLCHKGVPLEDAEQMWFDMCRADPRTRCGRFSTVQQFIDGSGDFGHYPKNHYKQQEKTQSSENYKGGFMSCQSVKNYYPGNCSFTDIEDLGKRRNSCAQQCWKRINNQSNDSSSSTTRINRASPWKDDKFWSPATATKKIIYYSKRK